MKERMKNKKELKELKVRLKQMEVAYNKLAVEAFNDKVDKLRYQKLYLLLLNLPEQVDE